MSCAGEILTLLMHLNLQSQLFPLLVPLGDVGPTIIEMRDYLAHNVNAQKGDLVPRKVVQ